MSDLIEEIGQARVLNEFYDKLTKQFGVTRHQANPRTFTVRFGEPIVNITFAVADVDIRDPNASWCGLCGEEFPKDDLQKTTIHIGEKTGVTHELDLCIDCWCPK